MADEINLESLTEVEYWQGRALDAEKMLELERQYINDLYELRDSEMGWCREYHYADYEIPRLMGMPDECS
jgi:hypothetical protein